MARLEDAAAIARVHVASWEETYRGKLPDHAIDAISMEVRLAEWERGLPASGRWTHVHESNGTIDGFACAQRSDEEPGFDVLLSTLYVLRASHGKGVARALLAATAATLLDEEIRAMWLLTLRDENPARAFYERMGARLLREQPAPPALGEGVMDVVYAFDNLERLLGNFPIRGA